MSNPSDLTDHLGYLLRQVSNHVSRSFAGKIEAEGVSVAEWVLMRVLYDRAMAPTRVAEAMGFTRGAITKLADRLIAKDLLTRAADAQDGRAQTLALTAKGRRLTLRLAALADQNDAECFGHLCDRDRQHLRQILEDIVARLALDVTPVD
ncbi:MAG TPA: MarR family winged helix-turn-helix transcriptional regulator [Roseiarcus sp.]|nr:MarR family winged helix-turn-helix transcriptional regulator [Roseiarcus sp.]